MNDDATFKLVASLALFPIAILMLLGTWNLAAKSHYVETRWTRVEAQVVGDEQTKILSIKYTWKNEPIQVDVHKDSGFGSLSHGQKFEIFVNPKKPQDVRRASFDAQWGSVIVVGLFALLFSGAGAFCFALKSSKPFVPTTAQSWMEEAAQMQAKFEAEAKAEQAVATAPVPDDGGLIEMKEPSESWKANIFWGLLFGLLLLVPPYFAGPDVPLWKRVGTMFIGVAWMAFMGRSALQNRGRKVRMEGAMIEEIQPLGTRSISVYQVKKITRCDVRAKLREFEDIGRSRTKTRGLDTTPDIVVYKLYGERGEELLKLDEHMQPPSEMHRFLARLEAQTGTKVVDE